MTSDNIYNQYLLTERYNNYKTSGTLSFADWCEQNKAVVESLSPSAKARLQNIDARREKEGRRRNADKEDVIWQQDHDYANNLAFMRRHGIKNDPNAMPFPTGKLGMEDDVAVFRAAYDVLQEYKNALYKTKNRRSYAARGLVQDEQARHWLLRIRDDIEALINAGFIQDISGMPKPQKVPQFDPHGDFASDRPDWA